MIKFRPHRGTLSDSMKEVVEMQNMQALSNYLAAHGFGAGHLKIKSYGYDSRISWNTHIALLDGKPVGWTDGMFDECSK